MQYQISAAKPYAAKLFLIFVITRLAKESVISALSVPSASRRAFVATSTTAVATSILGTRNKVFAAGIPSVYEGMAAFASNKVEDSVAMYDSIIREDPRRKPYLWQRGLSLYYAGRYAEGADQFAVDVAVNPNDTEEQIWHLLCLAADEGGSLDNARTKRLTVGKDRRPVMRLVQKLFLGDESIDSETELMALAKNPINAGNQFYASLYLSLYYESVKDEKASQQWMTNAVGTEYARSVGRRDPMVDVAKVAMKRRGWDL